MWQLSVTRDCFQVFISFIVRFLTSQHVVWTRWIDSSWHTEQIQGTEICVRFVNKLRHKARNQQLWFAKESRPQSDSTWFIIIALVPSWICTTITSLYLFTSCMLHTVPPALIGALAVWILMPAVSTWPMHACDPDGFNSWEERSSVYTISIYNPLKG